jgi:dTDP-4-amino-4,6-dideoxygalactose transaminase
MPVHLYGQAADMEALVRIARRHDLRIIEDAAQAIGTEYAGARVGSIGDIGCFSFFPSKNLGAFGDAGLCTTGDEDLAEHMRVLRVHGGKPKYFHALIGGNFRIDELQAAILRVKLRHLDAWTEARRRNAAYYTAAFERAGLGARVVPPAVATPGRHIFNQYVIRAERRDQLRAGDRNRDLLSRAAASAAVFRASRVLSRRLPGIGACGRRHAGAADLPRTLPDAARSGGRGRRGVLRLIPLHG